MRMCFQFMFVFSSILRFWALLSFGTHTMFLVASAFATATANKLELDHELNGLWPFMPQRDEIVKFILSYIFGRPHCRCRRRRYGRVTKQQK